MTRSRRNVSPQPHAQVGTCESGEIGAGYRFGVTTHASKTELPDIVTTELPTRVSPDLPPEVPVRNDMWIDCDPGHDDVVAILMASRFANIVGISTVAGNAPITATTHNALVTTQLFDLDVAVCQGADRPLVRPPVFAPNIHGASGLAGPVLPALTREASTDHGVIALLEASHVHRGMWLIPLGPLTNIALALRLDPTLIDRIAGISLMGGGPTFGNSTPWAEFNIWADPEAAAIVFSCGADIMMCGLNVTHEVLVSLDDAEATRAVGGMRAEFLADVLTHFATAYKDVFFTEALGPLHDPCAVLALTHPDLFTFERFHVDIELQGSKTRGMTVVDQRGVKSGQTPNVSVATKVRGNAVKQVILHTLQALAGASTSEQRQQPQQPLPRELKAVTS